MSTFIELIDDPMVLGALHAFGIENPASSIPPVTIASFDEGAVLGIDNDVCIFANGNMVTFSVVQAKEVMLALASVIRGLCHKEDSQDYFF